MLDAHCYACIFDGRLQSVSRATLAVDLQTIPTEDLHVSCDRYVNVAVNRITEECPPLLFDAHNAHRQSTNLQCLSDRILVRKKLILDIAAQNDHKSRALNFIGRDKASVFNGLVFDVNHVCGCTKNDSSWELNSILLQISAASSRSTNFST